MKSFRKSIGIATLLVAASFMTGCDSEMASNADEATKARKSAAASKNNAPIPPECALLTRNEAAKALATKVSEGRLSVLDSGCQWTDISKDNTDRKIILEVIPVSSWWGGFPAQTERTLEGIGEKAYLTTTVSSGAIIGWTAIAHTKKEVVSVWISWDPAIAKTGDASAVELLKIAVGRLK
jgi:hypothetical protein